MSKSSSRNAAVRMYALAVRAFPPRVRRLYGTEMVAAFAASHAAARTTGAPAARRYTWKATGDALRAGLRERLGNGGVGTPSPRTPVGRWANRGRDALWREIGGDIRFAARTLRRSPGFTATVLLVLALGVGINGAVFTAVNAALLSPLPFADPEELVILEFTMADAETPERGRGMGWSWIKYSLMADDLQLPLDGIAAFSTTSFTLTGRGDTTRTPAEAITPDYFGLLGVDLALGRPFTAADGDGGEPAVILSSGLWQGRFGSDPGVIGDSLTLNGHTVTIVGVAPRGFRGLSDSAELWVPVPAVGTLVSPVRLRPHVHWLTAIARARDGVTVEQIGQQMPSTAAAIDAAYPIDEPGMVVGGSARSMAAARRNPRAQRAVLVIGAAAGLVLLIACINLAALMLARGGERRREIAVRLALGGSRARVARGMVTETLLLSLGGSLLGMGVAAVAIRAMVSMWPATFSSGNGWDLAFVDPSTFALDASTLAYILALGLLTGVLFGAGPALRLSRADLGTAMKEGNKSSTPSHGSGFAARRWLVSIEIAAALVLLVGAGLMVGSLGQLLDIDTGFNEDNLLVFSYSLPRTSAFADNPAAFHDELLTRLRTLPQVESAAGGLAPLRGYHWSIVGVASAGDRVYAEGERKGVGIQTVTDDYFATLRAALLRGRVFDSRDQAGSTPAIVISETAAQDFFGDADPIGQAFVITYGPTADGTPAEIIGVVADVLYGDRENGIMAEAYFLQRQNPEGDLDVIVRTHGEPFAVVPEVRAAIAAIDPNVAVEGITTMDALATAQVSDTRVVMQLLGVFAAMAALLAATGVWGVVSYSVVQRRRELGIRMALGARSQEAAALILRGSVVNAVVGVAVGSLVALGLTRYLESLLYETDPNHPAAFAGAATALLAIAVLAAWIPALRATRINPVETLHGD